MLNLKSYGFEQCLMITPKMMLMFAGMSVVIKEVANELLTILRNNIKQKRSI